jgi:hypothetical protein
VNDTTTPPPPTPTAVAERCSDAYSADRFSSWTACAKVCLARGYSVWETEDILRSKMTRWAADASDARYGRVPAKALATYLDRLGRDKVATMLEWSVRS